MRHWIIPYLFLEAFICNDAQAQWNLEVFGGYARTFQLTNMNGGLEMGTGVFYSLPKLTVGLEASSLRLGGTETTLTYESLFPPVQLITRTIEEHRSGFRVTAVAQTRLRRVTMRVGLGIYGHTRESTSQQWDSTGAVLEPRTRMRDNSRGPGGLFGVGFGLLSLSDRIRLRVQVDSHFMLVKSTSGIGGYGFLHYANGGVRMAIGF